MNKRQYYAYIVICFLLSFATMYSVTTVIWVQTFVLIFISGMVGLCSMKYLNSKNG